MPSVRSFALSPGFNLNPVLRTAAGILAMVVVAGWVRADDGAITGRDVIPDCPAWVHHAVCYQIYPQSFYDSDGDGIGDLRGITQKLDYVKSLGADAIWLNPFFDSPFNDAGYDIRDYYRVAPRYGTNEDARRLFAEAHRRGIKVLFDYVVTYTAIDHPWFVESSRQAPGPHSNWYIWTNNVWKSEPGDQWVHGYGQRNGNFLSNFFWSEPALDYGFGRPDPAKPWQLPADHPDVLALRAEMQKVMRFWMDLGADGFRADMANAMVKGEDPRHESKRYWQEVRQILRRDYPKAFAIAEWSDPPNALDEAFHACFYHWAPGFDNLYQKESWRIGNGMSEGHSFFDRAGRGDITAFLQPYLSAYEASRRQGYTCLPLGNHDLARLNNRRTVDELEMIMAFGLTMPGVPFIYYGNEIGMRQLENLPQREGAYRPRAGARTPMQWSAGANLGFSTADPSRLYLPVDAAPDAPTVAAEEKDPDSLLNRVRRLIRFKHEEPALAAYAEFVPLYARPGAYPFIFARASGARILLAIFNPADRPATAEFRLGATHRGFTLLAGKPMRLVDGPDATTADVPAVSYAVYRVDR